MNDCMATCPHRQPPTLILLAHVNQSCHGSVAHLTALPLRTPPRPQTVPGWERGKRGQRQASPTSRYLRFPKQPPIGGNEKRSRKKAPLTGETRKDHRKPGNELETDRRRSEAMRAIPARPTRPAAARPCGPDHAWRECGGRCRCVSASKWSGFPRDDRRAGTLAARGCR